MKTDVQGFTLIELLVVVTLLGILVVIAIPRFGDARDKAYRAQMQTDLRTLVSAQEAYFDTYKTYSDQVSGLEFNQSQGVIVSIVEATPAGWSAEATHANTSIICGFYTGPVTPPPSVPVSEALIDCTG